MVGEMENLKVKANNESERKEIQLLLSKLGYNFVNNIACEKGFVVASLVSSGINFDYWADVKEISLQYLRDLVVLKRNDIFDANYESESGNRKYYLTDTEFFEFILGVWVNIDELVDGVSFKFIDKEGEVKMKEFLNPEQDYALVECFVGETPIPSGWIEIPEGAEEYRANYKFYKNNGEFFYCSYSGWSKSIMSEYKTLWQRNTSTLESRNTTTQEKLKFIEKWLNGEKIQYILGVESEKTQWHNFTEGAMQYIKRSDIKFREAPKYVTINGIEFKSVESLLKHVKNNFDLEDGDKG